MNMEIQFNAKFNFQDHHICAHPQPIPDPEAMSVAETLPSIVSSELDSITICYNSSNANTNADFTMDAYNSYPSEALLNIHNISSSSTSPSSSPYSSDIGYQSPLEPSSPSDCGSDYRDLGHCLNNNSGCGDSGNESNEAEDNDVDDPDYVPLAKKTTLCRFSEELL